MKISLGNTPTWGTLLFICCAIAFASYFASYMRIPVVPLFATSLGAGPLEVGLINSAFLLMMGILSFPLGVLSDRVGRKPLIVWGLIISLVTSILLYFSQTPGQLIAIYLVFGIGLAGVGPTLMSYVADISPLSHLGRSYGWYTTAIYSGMSLGPAVGGWLAQALGFRPLFIIAALCLIPLVLLVAVWLPDSVSLKDHRRPQAAPSPTARELLKNLPLMGCWLITLGGCFGQGMFLTFVPLHAHQQGLKVGQIGLIFAVQAICNALSRLPLGRLSDTVGHRGRLAALGFLAFGASLAGFGLSRTLAHFLLAAMASGAAMGLAFTPLGAFISETVPPQSRGLAMGGYNTCIYLGMMLSSALMGGVIGRIGFAAGFLLTALLTFLVTGWYYLLVKDFSSAQQSLRT
jgi:MFS family permease